MRNMKVGIRNVKRIGVFLIGLFFIMACGAGSTENEEVTEAETAQSSTKKMSLIEKFDFEDLEGNKFNWDDTKGKLVVVNFWATWCKPCIKEMPSISEANSQLKDQNVVFIVASDEDVEKIKKFESKHHYSFKLMRSNASVFDLEVQALPTTLIINEEGEIVFNEIGARDWASEKSIALIKSFSTKQLGDSSGEAL